MTPEPVAVGNTPFMYRKENIPTNSENQNFPPKNYVSL
jgi:hypothetical protein